MLGGRRLHRQQAVRRARDLGRGAPARARARTSSSPTAATPTRSRARRAPTTSAPSPRAVAAALDVSPDDVLTSSTGAIGARLPVDKIRAAMPALLASLGDDVAGAAEAIRTTDLRTKLAFRQLESAASTVRLVAIAKGSGMIHPQMATMLCYVTTDAAIAPVTLQAALVGGHRGDVQHDHRRRRHVDERHGDRARQRQVGRAAHRARQPRVRGLRRRAHRPARRARARHRRRRRGRDQAARRRRRGRCPSARWRATSRAPSRAAAS